MRNRDRNSFSAIRTSLLFLGRCGSPFARWRNNALEPHVGYKIAVMFHGMHIVKIQHAEFGHVHSDQLHHLSARSVCHTVISFVTIGNGILESCNKIDFSRLGLLDFESGISLSESATEQKVYCASARCPTIWP